MASRISNEWISGISFFSARGGPEKKIRFSKIKFIHLPKMLGVDSNGWFLSCAFFNVIFLVENCASKIEKFAIPNRNTSLEWQKQIHTIRSASGNSSIAVGVSKYNCVLFFFPLQCRWETPEATLGSTFCSDLHQYSNLRTHLRCNPPI